MAFTKENYPNSMKTLTAEVRYKAIEIANALLDQGYEEDRAIPIAIDTAEEWAKNRNKQIKKKRALK